MTTRFEFSPDPTELPTRDASAVVHPVDPAGYVQVHTDLLRRLVSATKHIGWHGPMGTEWGPCYTLGGEVSRLLAAIQEAESSGAVPVVDGVLRRHPRGRSGMDDLLPRFAARSVERPEAERAGSDLWESETGGMHGVDDD